MPLDCLIDFVASEEINLVMEKKVVLPSSVRGDSFYVFFVEAGFLSFGKEDYPSFFFFRFMKFYA